MFEGTAIESLHSGSSYAHMSTTDKHLIIGNDLVMTDDDDSAANSTYYGMLCSYRALYDYPRSINKNIPRR